MIKIKKKYQEAASAEPSSCTAPARAANPSGRPELQI